MYAGPVVDAHVHFWNPARLDYPWLKQVQPLNRTFLPAAYAESSGGSQPEGIVFVECGCSPENAQAEAQWAADLAAGGAPIQGIVAQVPLEQVATLRIVQGH